LRLDIDLDRLVDELATRVAVELADRIASQARSPWMAMEESIAYTRIPAGTFRKWVAAGRIPAHGGRRKLFHRDELDAALGHGDARPLELRRATTGEPRCGRNA
jgi:excisionase family DNA binding protein